MNISKLNPSDFLFAVDGEDSVVLVPKAYFLQHNYILDEELSDQLCFDLPEELEEVGCSTFVVNSDEPDVVLQDLEDMGMERSEELSNFLNGGNNDTTKIEENDIPDLSKLTANNFIFAHMVDSTKGNIIVMVPKQYWSDNTCLMPVEIDGNLPFDLPGDLYEESDSVFSIDEDLVDETIEELKQMGMKESSDLLDFIQEKNV